MPGWTGQPGCALDRPPGDQGCVATIKCAERPGMRLPHAAVAPMTKRAERSGRRPPREAVAPITKRAERPGRRPPREAAAAGPNRPGDKASATMTTRDRSDA